MPALKDSSARDVRLTWDDFVRFPDDGHRHELIDGAHVVTPSPVKRHQAIATAIAARIFSYLEAHPLGTVYASPVDTILSTHDVLAPDVVYVSHARERQLEASPWIKGAPSLVVEVESPSTRTRDRTVKKGLYERFGIDEYWLVDPNAETITAFRRSGGQFAQGIAFRAAAGDVVTTPELPGFELPLSPVFK